MTDVHSLLCITLGKSSDLMVEVAEADESGLRSRKRGARRRSQWMDFLNIVREVCLDATAD